MPPTDASGRWLNRRSRGIYLSPLRFVEGPLTVPGKGDVSDHRDREPDESFANALKRFEKQCEKPGLLSELQKRQHDEKPSVERKRKALAARKKVQKRQRMSG